VIRLAFKDEPFCGLITIKRLIGKIIKRLSSLSAGSRSPANKFTAAW